LKLKSCHRSTQTRFRQKYRSYKDLASDWVKKLLTLHTQVFHYNDIWSKNLESSDFFRHDVGRYVILCMWHF
jgi:hypothetical protein